MMVLYIYGHLTELLPCQVAFYRLFIIKEHITIFFSVLPILYILKSWHKNSGGLVAEQLSDLWGEEDQLFMSFHQSLEEGLVYKLMKIAMRRANG